MNLDIKKTLSSGLSDRHSALLFAAATYYVFSFCFFGTTMSWTHWYLGGGADPICFVWFLRWWEFSVFHELNPFVSHFIWFPKGYNLTWATSIPFPAALIMPITIVGGPILAYNVLSISAPALSAFSAFLLTNEITNDFQASLIGGFLFGFSTYEDSQILGHLNLALTCFVPIIFFLCLRRFKGKIQRLDFILSLALILLFQTGISLEILATTCTLGALYWIIFLLLSPKQCHKKIFYFGIEIICSALCLVAFASPFLWYFFSGIKEFPGSFFSAVYYAAEPLNFIIPTYVTSLGHSTFAPIAAKFTGNISEQGAYIGIPLTLIIIFFFLENLKNVLGRSLFLITILIIILSLGPKLQFCGIITNITLPWRFLLSAPLIHAALPARLTMFVSLCTAIIVSIWLTHAQSKTSRVIRFLVACLGCIFLLPNKAAHFWTLWPANPFFSSQHIYQALGSIPNVIILPFAEYGPAMAWQVNSNFQFTQAAGYVGYPPRNEQSLAIFQELKDALPGTDFENDLSIYCYIHKVNFILLGPTTSPVLASAIEHLGWLRHTDGDVEIIEVPQLHSLTYGYIQGDYWPSSSIFNFMGKRISVFTNGASYHLIISGEYRPLNSPVLMTVTNQFGEATYKIDGEKSRVDIELPASATTIVTAGKTFVPDDVFHNGDERNLSAMVAISRYPSNPE